METFRTFRDAKAAQELAVWLTDRGIKAEVADTSVYFDPSFAHSILSKEWALRIVASDFTRATQALHDFYLLRLNSIPKDYYLFTFSDVELEDILLRPDEWGDLDYVLAQHILQQRGTNITEEQLHDLRSKRYEALSRPDEERAGHFIGWGYGLAVFGGFIGSMIGWYLVNSHKILPDGKKVPRYATSVRVHGRRIFRIGIVVTIAFGLLQMFSSYERGIGSIYR